MRRFALLVLLLFALAACGGTSPVGGEGPPEEPPAELPADAVVVDVAEGPGFTPVNLAVDRRPTFRLYGDGTVLATPPDTRWTGGYPELATYRLSAEGIEAVLAAAEREGLLAGPADYGMPPVTDLGTTVVTLAGLDGAVEHSAYALGFEDESGTLSAAQLEARERLTRFLGFTASLPERTELLAAEPAPYEPDGVDVYAWPYEGELAGADVRRWPFAPLGEGAPAEPLGGRCQTVTDTAALRELLAGAEPFTVWRSGGELWTLGFDVVLPGESGCT